jgi:phosphoglycerate dehydrogenase-like enzyme
MSRRILFLPNQKLARDILSPSARDMLLSLGEVEWNDCERNLSRDEVKERLAGVDAVVTSWGSPSFDAELLATADRLAIVGHAAGSVKNLMPKEGYDRGIVVLSGAAVIADSVAEYTLWAMLNGQRDLYRYGPIMKEQRGWTTPGQSYGHELYYKRVGIVAASMVGQRVIQLLAPFHCDILLYDPYVSAERAAELGVRLVSLEQLFAESDIVSIHAPTTPETKEMIGAQHFGAMRDGALLVNTARCWVIQREPMLDALRSGRIHAVLDVYHKEPLAVDDPLRDMDNVFLTPHISGFTTESRLRLVEAIGGDMQRFFAGEPLRYAVSWQRLQIMA